MKHIVLAIIKNDANQLLIAKRPPKVDRGDLWEVPGGKVEAGETPLAAIQREVLEEVGLTVVSAIHLEQFTHEYDGKQFLFDVFHIDQYVGEAIGAEGQEIQWIAFAQLKEYTFPAANVRLNKHLQVLLNEPLS